MSKNLHCHECGACIDSDLLSADKMRQRFFAALRDCHASLKPEQRERFPTSETLRKQALIAVGWCDVATVIAGSKKAAPGIAAYLRMRDPYCIIKDSGTEVLTVLTARSMARRALPKKEFLDVSEKVFDWIYQTTGVDLNQWEQAA